MSITGFNLRRRKLEEAKKAAELEAKRAEEAAALEAEKIALEKGEDPADQEADQEDPATEAIDYSSLKVEQLKEIAKEKGIEGYSDMKKAELISNCSILSEKLV